LGVEKEKIKTKAEHGESFCNTFKDAGSIPATSTIFKEDVSFKEVNLLS